MSVADEDGDKYYEMLGRDDPHLRYEDDVISLARTACTSHDPCEYHLERAARIIAKRKELDAKRRLGEH